VYKTEIELTGHLIDTQLLSRVIDEITDLGGEFEVLDTTIGKTRDDVSWARLEVRASSCDKLDRIVKAAVALGAVTVDAEEVKLGEVKKDGVCPEGFYSSTNLETFVNVGGTWVEVENIEMDCAVVVDPVAKRARCCPIGSVRAGEMVILGSGGVRVASAPASDEDSGEFSFMGSDVSSERQKFLVLRELAEEMKRIRARGGKILVVAGPAVIHTGAAKHLSKLIDAGYVNVFFAGNAVAVHDVEAAFFGTSLGVNLNDGTAAPAGHMHHLMAINRIRDHGGLRQAVEAGALTSGVMYSLIKNDVPYVLAGSIRDDGPLPDVITDTVKAQEAMRSHLPGVELAVMIATMLHSIATGNLLPARVRTICVDINPATVTKLADRGSHQAIGIVSDVEWFLKELASLLVGEAVGQVAGA
jgi:lysine-ketoglutarate reductase/saccharopine dehydrogenase-like protein (TIGR00300 family)